MFMRLGPQLAHGYDTCRPPHGEDARLPGSPYDRRAEPPRARIPAHVCVLCHGPRTCDRL